MNKVYKLRKGYVTSHTKIFQVRKDDIVCINIDGNCYEGTDQVGEILLKTGKYEECDFDMEKYLLARKLMQ